jgi:ERCC4-related helicase
MAWALSELVDAHPAMQNYRVFSFVGVSNPAHEGVLRFANLRAQNENLEKFRRGELNLCIATSVLEEGVDVPAMNLVICFDERPNIRSFVQSRGRARHQQSKFVMLRSAEEPNTKLQQWHALEEEMKLECDNSFRALEDRQAAEMQDEAGGEVFRVESTG